MTEMDSVVEEFLEETGDLLETVSDDVLTLEKRRDDEVVNRVYRALHTVKGNASMLGYDRLSSFSHKMEDLLSLVRSGELDVDRDTAEVLLLSLDTLKLILRDIREGGDDGRGTSGLAQLMDDIMKPVRSPKGPPPAPSRPAPPSATPPGRDPPAPAAPSSAGAPRGFTLDLSPPAPPAAPQAPKAELPASPEAEEPEPAAEARKRLRVLVVEDDFTSRQILVRFLSRYGECDVAKDGLEALDAVSYSFECDPPEPYDLICMDVNMPKMDGMRAAKTIREIERGKGVVRAAGESAIVMVSAVDDVTTIVRACYECGANYYFVKPLDLAQMSRQLRKLHLIP